MCCTRFLRFLFAVALIPHAALIGQAAAPTRTVLLVNQSNAAGWQDLALLAAVPAACKANEGSGPVIALGEDGLIPREVDDYLRRYKPAAICHVGAKPLGTAVEPGQAAARFRHRPRSRPPPHSPPPSGARAAGSCSAARTTTDPP